MQNAVQIDEGFVLSVAERQGFMAPANAERLQEMVAQAERDLASLRSALPGLSQEIDAIFEAARDGQDGFAADAFDRVEARLAFERRTGSQPGEALDELEAKLVHAQAVLIGSDDYGAVIPLLSRAIELRPNTFRFRYDRAFFHLRTGQLEQADKDMGEILLSFASFEMSMRETSQLYALLGSINREKGLHAGAVGAFRHALMALEHHPFGPDGAASKLAEAVLLRYSLAIELRADGKGIEACTELEQALSDISGAISDLPKGYGLLALGGRKMLAEWSLADGDLETARQSLNQCLAAWGAAMEAEPESKEVTIQISALMLCFGHLQEAEENREDARTSYALAVTALAARLEDHADDPHLAWRLVEAQFALGQFLMRDGKAINGSAVLGEAMVRGTALAKANPGDVENRRGLWTRILAVADDGDHRSDGLLTDAYTLMAEHSGQGVLTPAEVARLTEAGWRVTR